MNPSKRPVDWMGEAPGRPLCSVPMPPAAAERLLQFIFDKRTGNVVLNIRDGEILKMELQEHIKI